MNVLSGNTILLESVFYDWEGALIDPSSVTVTIYNSKLVSIEELEPQNIRKGYYTVLYTVPDVGTYTYEFKGIIEGKPYINRASFTVKFKN